jgi:hypothetical protein
MLACESPFCSNSHEKVSHQSIYSWLYFKTFRPIRSLLLIRHKAAARAKRKKYNKYVALKGEMQRISILITDLQSSTLAPSPDFQPEIQIIGPDAVLRHLVFPYLDYRDLVKPICKLWTRLAGCNLLWKSLYGHHFGTMSIQRSNAVPHDWKLHFRSTLLAKYNVQGLTNNFGWPLRICPIVGCNKVLHSKFECDFHRLKHEEKYILDEMNCLKRLERDQPCLVGKRKRVMKKKLN